MATRRKQSKTSKKLFEDKHGHSLAFFLHLSGVDRKEAEWWVLEYGGTLAQSLSVARFVLIETGQNHTRGHYNQMNKLVNHVEGPYRVVEMSWLRCSIAADQLLSDTEHAAYYQTPYTAGSGARACPASTPRAPSPSLSSSPSLFSPPPQSSKTRSYYRRYASVNQEGPPASEAGSAVTQRRQRRDFTTVESRKIFKFLKQNYGGKWPGNDSRKIRDFADQLGRKPQIIEQHLRSAGYRRLR